MLSAINEDYEIDNDEVIELPRIQSIHYELINEMISEQIEDPFASRTNYFSEYFDAYKDQKEENGENEEIMSLLNKDARSFCNELINMIDEKYGLEIDEDNLADLSIGKLKNLTSSLYDFFVIHYPKNLKKFFVKFINQNIGELYDGIAEYKDRGDVTTIAMKSKIKDERVAIILSNLQAVISNIIDLDLDGTELLSVYNPDRYDIYIITEAIEDMIITSEGFTSKFFTPLIDADSNDNYTDIFTSIQSELIKKYKKEL